MTTADWTQVLAYASAGLGKASNCFAGHSAAANTVFTTTSGCVSANTAGSNKTTIFRISERLMQNFHNGDGVGKDNRLQNFTDMYLDTVNKTIYTNVTSGTRWSLLPVYRFISAKKSDASGHLSVC